jgi:hypothetical protein
MQVDQTRTPFGHQVLGSKEKKNGCLVVWRWVSGVLFVCLSCPYPRWLDADVLALRAYMGMSLYLGNQSLLGVIATVLE